MRRYARWHEALKHAPWDTTTELNTSQAAPLQLMHGANVNFTLLHVAFNCSTFLVRVVLATNIKKCVRRSVDETRKREHEGAAPGVKQDIIALRA